MCGRRAYRTLLGLCVLALWDLWSSTPPSLSRGRVGGCWGGGRKRKHCRHHRPLLRDEILNGSLQSCKYFETGSRIKGGGHVSSHWPGVYRGRGAGHGGGLVGWVRGLSKKPHRPHHTTPHHTCLQHTHYTNHTSHTNTADTHVDHVDVPHPFSQIMYHTPFHW